MKTIRLFLLTLAVSMISTGTSFAGQSLDDVLAAQDEAAQARFQYRNPKETLEFFGIKPGMTVVEALPGGGWYSKILLPYLGSDGALIGVDYSIDMWPLFGGFATEEFIEKRKSWTETWAADAAAWTDENGASVSAATFSTMPADAAGSADAVLFIRALHNLSRFESDGEYMTKAIKAAHDVLKPGGIVGVVQHHGREDRPDDWANGSNGYLKKSAVIAAMEAGGFEYVGESEVNANPKDEAGEGDFVWRLPPSLSGAGEDEELKAKMTAIGESNRMTLKFKKPA